LQLNLNVLEVNGVAANTRMLAALIAAVLLLVASITSTTLGLDNGLGQ